MSREELQDVWEDIVDRGYEDISSLTKEERVWFNLEPLTTDGIVDHYINHGGMYNSETIEDLNYLGETEIMNLMLSVNQKFKNGVPVDINERNNQLMEMGDEIDVFLEKIDSKFWKLCEGFEKRLYRYVESMFDDK